MTWRDLHQERSFLGPTRPTWGDLRRLRDLKRLASATRRRTSVLEALPPSMGTRQELERERAYLEATRREMNRLETLLALL